MLEQDSSEVHIIAQRRRIEYLEGENERLQKTIEVLRASLTHQTIEAERSFQDNIGKFDILSRQVWSVVAELNKVWRGPVDYDKIVGSFQHKHPDVAKYETITRRVREMVQNGWMESPSKGLFIVVAKPNP